MSTRAERRSGPDRLALGLAAAGTAAICVAAATGRGLDRIEVAAALVLAAAIGAVGLRAGRVPRPRPHVLSPVTSAATGPTVLAPRASSVTAADATGHSDAA